MAALFAFLIGLPVLRLKSDYLAIATLGFAEIIRAVFQWQKLGPVTNGSNMLKDYPTFNDFNITLANGRTLYLSTLMPFIIAGVCIAIVVLLINSSYGRAFKAIRDDEVAAEAMGINLARHKQLAFCISSFFAGVGGAMLAMYSNTIQAKAFTSAMTYEILLIVVIGGIGSISGSCVASFLFVACSEWWAALPRSGAVHRHVAGAALAQRLQAGGVLHHHHAGGAVLPAGHVRHARTARHTARQARPPHGKGGGEMSTVLKVNDITMQFGGVVAVNDLSMHVDEGEIVALIGPNGAGKTTAFNCITGVYEPTNGEV